MIEQNQAPVQPAKKPNLLKIFTILLSAGIFVVMATAIAYFVYQYYLNGKAIARYQQNISTYETNAAIMVTQQANTDAQLEQTMSDLDTARADIDKKKEKISELQTKVTKLTTEKAGAILKFNALYCESTVVETELTDIKTNSALKPLLAKKIELMTGEKVDNSDYMELWEEDKSALFRFDFGENYSSSIFVSWDHYDKKIHQIYLLNTGCLLYSDGVVDDFGAPST